GAGGGRGTAWPPRRGEFREPGARASGAGPMFVSAGLPPLRRRGQQGARGRGIVVGAQGPSSHVGSRPREDTHGVAEGPWRPVTDTHGHSSSSNQETIHHTWNEHIGRDAYFL